MDYLALGCQQNLEEVFFILEWSSDEQIKNYVNYIASIYLASSTRRLAENLKVNNSFLGSF